MEIEFCPVKLTNQRFIEFMVLTKLKLRKRPFAFVLTADRKAKSNEGSVYRSGKLNLKSYP